MWWYVIAFVLGVICGALVTCLAAAAAEETFEEKDW